MHSNLKILFLTPCLGTKWIKYQQYLIKLHFPKSSQVIINGARRWDFSINEKCVWYDFIIEALKKEKDFDYFVHIDEDCFITNPRIIEESIDRINNENLDLIGPKDVISHYRKGNPRALNSFLMIGKIKSLRKIWFNFDFNASITNSRGEFLEKEIYEHEEPYYNFFANYYNHKLNIGFINCDFDKDFGCTILLTNDNIISGYHMWFTRTWDQAFKVYGMPNYLRYKKMEHYLVDKYKLNKQHLNSVVSKPIIYKITLSKFTNTIRQQIKLATLRIIRKN